MRIALLLIVSLLNILYADPFTLIKKETNAASTPTMLVIGGIHGNEPGSYFATAILTQYYRITKGNLWIIPDLNRLSIQQDSRGINGDMNRKFADISPNDPDIDIVQKVQHVITEPQVGLVLNLHDGHGFYRKKYQNTIFNPNAWGQTCVIDQDTLDMDHPFGHLNQIALNISNELNDNLIETHHVFDVRNTNTKLDDEVMKHSLTYFAVTHNKPAFAIETSKNLSALHEKVFYQLRAIECYMKYMGIEFERPFDLTPKALEKIVTLKGTVTINNNLYLSLDNLKNSLSLIPLQSERNDFKFSHPLGSVRQNNQSYALYIGNKKIGSLIPSYYPVDNCKELLTIEMDGKVKNFAFATDFYVTADFKVINDNSKIRVNIIGFTKKGVKDESNFRVTLKDLDSNYSIDTLNKSYRVEFYEQNRFCGMVLAHFK
ncbi:MAG: M99 family carboxypeptidase catalytic domain-containing protein [Atribacterota bacterium]|nr:M99 family carboxypeptidase catalytic domain-containing protein [Atribacterota bacterium]